ncbi:Hypothetical protein POVR1_LOCUS526 [uncultured virus]|nr:Hypothetical protein POVR1_LOCUS526 [uncultured virus]
MAFPLQIVDLAIQRGDIDQLIGFYRSSQGARNYINQNLNELAAALGVNFINSFDEIVIAYHKAVIDQMKARIRWPPDGYDQLYLYAYQTGYLEVVRYVELIVKPQRIAGELSFLGNRANPEYTPWEIAVDYKNIDLLEFVANDPLASGLTRDRLREARKIVQDYKDKDLEEDINTIASEMKFDLSPLPTPLRRRGI